MVIPIRHQSFCQVIISCLSLNEFPVLIDDFPIQYDLGVILHSTDHIPVDHAFIVTARFGVTRPERHVEGTPKFLVEQDIVGKVVNFIVGPNGKFTQVTRPCV